MNSNIIKKLIERADQISKGYNADSNYIFSLHQGLQSLQSKLTNIKSDDEIIRLLKQIKPPTSKIEDLLLSPKEYETVDKNQSLAFSDTASLLVAIEKEQADFKKRFPSGSSTSEEINNRNKELGELKKICVEYSQRVKGFEKRNAERNNKALVLKGFTGLNPLSPDFNFPNIINSNEFTTNIKGLGRYIGKSLNLSKEINEKLKNLSLKLTGKPEVPKIQTLVDLVKQKNDKGLHTEMSLIIEEIDQFTKINKYIRETEQELDIPKNKIGQIDYNRQFVQSTSNPALDAARTQDPVKASIGSKEFTQRAKIAAALEVSNEGKPIDVKAFIREMIKDPTYKKTYDEYMLLFTEHVKKGDYQKINDAIDSFRGYGDVKLLGVVKAARKAALETKWDTDRSPKVMLLPEEALSEDLDEPLLPYATEIIAEENGIDPSGAINSENILASPEKTKVIQDKIRKKLYRHRIGYDLSNKVSGHLVRAIENISPLTSSQIDIKDSTQKLNTLTLLSREIALDLSDEVARVFDRNIEITNGNIIEARKATTEYLETKLKDLASIDKGVYATVERVKKEYGLDRFPKLTPDLLNEVVANASNGIRIIIENEGHTIVPDSKLTVKILSEADNQDSEHKAVLEIEEEVLAKSKAGRAIIAKQKGDETLVQSVAKEKDEVMTVKRVQRFVQLPNSDSIVEAIQRIGLEVEEGDTLINYAQKQLELRDKYRATEKDIHMSEEDEEIVAALTSGRLIPYLDKKREDLGEDFKLKLLGKVVGEENLGTVGQGLKLSKNIQLLRNFMDHPSFIRQYIWEKGIPFIDSHKTIPLRTKVRRAIYRGIGLRRKMVLDDGQVREVNAITFFGRRLFADRVDDFSNTKVAKFLGLDKTLKRENRKKKGSILELALSIVGRTISTLALKILKRIPLVKNAIDNITSRYNNFIGSEGGRLFHKSLATVKIAGNISSAGIAGIQRGALGAIVGGLTFGPLGGVIGGTVYFTDGFVKTILHNESNIYNTPLMKNIDSWFGAELSRNRVLGVPYINTITKGPMSLADMLQKDRIVTLNNVSTGTGGLPEKIFETRQSLRYNPGSGLTEIRILENKGLSRLFELKGPIGIFMRALRASMAGRFSTLLGFSKSGFLRSVGSSGIKGIFKIQNLSKVTSTLSSSFMWGTLGYVLLGSNPLAGVAIGLTKIALDWKVTPFIKNGIATGKGYIVSNIINPLKTNVINPLVQSRLGRFVGTMFRLPVFESLGIGAGVYTAIDTIRTLFDDTLTTKEKIEIITNPLNLVTGTLNIFGYVRSIPLLTTGISTVLSKLPFVKSLASVTKFEITANGLSLNPAVKAGMIVGSIVGGIVGLLMGGGPATIILASTAGAIVGGVLAGILIVAFPPTGVIAALVTGVVGGVIGGTAGGFLGGLIGRGLDSLGEAAGNLLKLIGVFLGFKKLLSSTSFKERMAAIIQLAMSVVGIGVLGTGAAIGMGMILPFFTPGKISPTENSTTAVKKYEKQINPNTLLYSITIKKGTDFSDPKSKNIDLNFLDEMDQTKISSITILGVVSSNFNLSSNGKSIIYKYAGDLKNLNFETIQYQVNLTSPLKDMNVPNGLCNALNGSSLVSFDGKANVNSTINQSVCIDKNGKELKQTKGNRNSFLDNAGLPVSPDAGSVTQCSYSIGGGGSHSTYKAIDIGAPSGTPVTPPTNGVVRTVSYQPNGYGLFIKIEHIVDAGKLQTTYGHLSKVNVSEGDTVTSTTVIGEVGTTGNSTGNHLHFETHINGNAVEPCCLIDCSKYKTYSLNNALSCTNKTSAFYTDSRTQCNY